MAINLSDNLAIQTSLHVDNRYGPYAGADEAAALSAANSAILSGVRFIGLTVGIQIASDPILEYWYADGVADVDLILKTTSGGGTGTTYDAVSLTTNPNSDVCTGGTGSPADIYAGKSGNTFEFRGIKSLNDNITVTYDDCFIYIGGKSIEPVGSNITVVDNLCNGESAGEINIYVTGGSQSYRFSIDGGSTFTAYGTGNTQTYTGLTAGVYNVKIDDEIIGNIINVNKTITEPTALSFTTSVTNVSVVGQSDGAIQVIPSGGSGGYEYSFDGGSNYSGLSDTLTGATETSYSVIVKDSNGCLTSPQTVEVENDNIQITITSVSFTDPTCPSGTGTITINAANGSGYYEFSIDGTNFYPTTSPFTTNYRTFSTGIVAGAYTNITVKDHNTMDTVAYGSTVTLTDPSGITLDTKTQTDALCGGSATVYIKVIDTNGQAQISLNGISYTNMTLVSTGVYDYTYSFNTVGVTSGTIYYKDTCNQAGSTSYSVSKYNAVAASTSSSTAPSCAGDDWSYTFSLSGGQGTYEYRIGSSGAFTTCTSTPTITITSSASASASTETVYFRDIVNTSCTTSLSVNNSKVTAVAVTLSSSTNPTCSTGTGSFTVSASGGRVDISNTYEYAKITAGVIGTYGASATFTSLTANTYNVAVRRAGTSCTSVNLVSNVTITIPTAVTVTVASSINPTTCSGTNGSILVNVSGGSGTYFYSTNNGSTYNGSAVTPTSGQITISTLSAGSYTVLLKDANNCVMTGSGISVVLAAPTSPSLSGTYTAPLCNGNNATVALSASGGSSPYTYSSDGSSYGTGSSISIASYSSGRTFYVKDSNNCVTTFSVTGTGQPSALSLTSASTNETSSGANDGTLTPAFSGGTGSKTIRIQDSSSADISGSPFSSATTGTAYTGLTPDTYTITLTDANSCTTSISKSISAGAVVSTLYYFRANLDGTAYPPNNYVETSGIPIGPYDLTTLGTTFLDAATFTTSATLVTVVSDYLGSLSTFGGGSVNLSSVAPSGWSSGSPVSLPYGTKTWDSGLHILVPNSGTYVSLTSGTHLTDAANIPFNAYNSRSITISGTAYIMYSVYNSYKAAGISTTITIK